MALEALYIPLVLVAILVGIWDAVWKAIGLWKSGRNNQLAWFVVLFIFNTAGILPILYILFFQKKK
jgi:methionyl-tRNA synthetase